MGIGVLLMMVYHWSVYLLICPIGALGYALTYFPIMPEILRHSEKTLYASFLFVITLGVNMVYWTFIWDVAYPIFGEW